MPGKVHWSPHLNAITVKPKAKNTSTSRHAGVMLVSKLQIQPQSRGGRDAKWRLSA